MNQITAGQEKELRNMVVNLNRTADEMSKLLKQINEGNGTLGKFIKEDEVYNNLQDFTRDIKTHPWKLLKKN